MPALPRSLFFVMAAATLVRGPCLVNWYPNLRILEFSSSIWAISISTAVPNCCLCRCGHKQDDQERRGNSYINYAWKDVQLFVGQKGKSLNLKQSHLRYFLSYSCSLFKSKIQEAVESAGMLNWKDQANYLQRKWKFQTYNWSKTNTWCFHFTPVSVV